MVAGYTALTALSRQGSAVSREAATVRRNATTLVERTEQSVALFGPKAVALSELSELAAECALKNWDGYGAEALDIRAWRLAQEIIRSLPDDMAMPSFSIEPDGCVSMDWMPSRERTFTLSAGKSDRLPYAWIDGTDRGHAVAKFAGGQLPPRIVQEINRISGHDSVKRIGPQTAPCQALRAGTPRQVRVVAPSQTPVKERSRRNLKAHERHGHGEENQAVPTGLRQG